MQLLAQVGRTDVIVHVWEGVYCWHVSGIYAVVMPVDSDDATTFIVGMPSFLTTRSSLVTVLADGGGGGVQLLCLVRHVACART